MSNNLLLHVQNQADSCNDPTKYYTGSDCQKCPQIDHMHSEAVIYCTHGDGQHADDRKFANATDTNLCQIGYSAKFGTGNTADSCQLIDPNLDPNLDPNSDQNFNPNLDQNLDPNLNLNLNPNLNPNLDTSIIVLIGIVSGILVVVAVIMFLKFKKKKDIKYNRLESVTNVSSPSTSKLNF